MTAVVQRSFAGGEIAPALYARTDQSKYATALRTLRNMLVMRHGGVTNRAGTEFGAEVKDSSKTVRFIPFVFSASQSYVLEFGDFYMRIVQDNAQVVVSGVAAWNIATNYVVGDLASRLGVNYYCILAHVAQQPPNTTYWYPLAGSIYEIPTPYTTADLATLDFVQSADVVTIVHPSYVPRELKRFGNTDWTLTPITFAPAIAGPDDSSAFTLTGGTAPGTITVWWGITAIDEITGEESLRSDSQQTSINIPSAAAPTTVVWPTVTGARAYNVYRSTDAVSFGWIGYALGNSFTDEGQTPDSLHAPPIARDPFDAAGKYPSAVAYYQQRRVFANTTNNPETVYASRSGRFQNFTTTFPIQDDDAVTFSLVGRRVNVVKHMLDLGRLILFTESEEKFVEGDNAGILRADAINPRKISGNGSSSLRPLEIDSSAIYLQARSTKVRDLKQPIADSGYEGTDLTIFAAHLFEGYTIVDWDYAQNPHSIVWAVRSDGVLLGLTYLREHSIWGWHRHDTDGVVENVCVIPEGNDDSVYLLVKRTINGSTKRYIERMAARYFTDETDAFFVDCGLSYDGWNAGATTITLSGGTDWDDEELLSATASASTFVAGDVDNAVIMLPYTDDEGDERTLRFRVTSYSSGTVVQGFADRDVPSSLRSTAVTDWALAKKTFTGLSHLEGKSLAVLGDAYVAASPNNPAYDAVTVTGGSITLDTAYAVVHAGLPFLSDLVTLDLDSPGSATIKDKKLLVNGLGAYVERSRGIWTGLPDQPTDDDPTNGLQEYKARDEEDWDTPIEPVTDSIELETNGDWNTNGRMLIRQVDPLPLTVLSITPMGFIPG